MMFTYPMNNTPRNFFPLPNEIVCLGLTPGELAVYMFLMRCEDRRTYQCHPSYKTISRAVHLSRNTVARHVASLEEKGLIKTQPTEIVTKDGERRNGTLLYTILPIEDAIRRHHEEQVRRAGEECARRKLRQMQEEYARR